MYKAPENSTVAVLGASPKENRYSFKAVKMLKEYGHKPIPVHPAGHTVDGVLGVSSLDQIDAPVDTVTCYVNAKISDGAYDQIVKLQPKRVIFNPGAENEELAEKLKEDGIEVLNACTLVMLRTDQF
ncbi:MAG: CoA-binding protein [candidate division Zixibacteria bacterium]|nr:CoA-binding protein [candidate division Zixibacteria bacterium]